MGAPFGGDGTRSRRRGRPRLKRRAWQRLFSFFRKPELDRELHEELRSHIELATEDYLQRGVPPAEARRLARIKFGAVEAAKDAHRDSRSLPWLEGLSFDLRFAVRGLRRDRAYTITAILMLTLAIALNVTTFAVMNTALFRGFPLVKRNDRILYMQERNRLGTCCISYLDFEDWRAQAKSFVGMAWVAGKPVTFREDPGGRETQTGTVTVSSNTFGLLGVRPMLGRDFVPADETPGAPQVAILNYRFWHNRFGARPDIVGHTVQINRAPVTIIGVMPEGFDFPEKQNFWMPMDQAPELRQRTLAGYLVVGRLAEGATVKSARAELETINRSLASAYPATNKDVVPHVSTYSQFVIGPDGPVVYGSLWAAAWFVLLIACANLANLTLARTIGRSREFSTRLALGAGHSRMIRQMLSESLLLTGAAGLLAWWLTNWSVRTWAVATESRYQVFNYALDQGTIAYLIAISIAAALFFSLAPIGRILHLDVNGTLKGDARGATQGLRARYLSAALVAGQMALAIILLAGAGIIVRSFENVVRANLGIHTPEQVVTGWVTLPLDGSLESQARFFDSLKTRLEAIPGVEAESVANSLPVDNPPPRRFEIENPSGNHDAQGVITMVTGSDYLRTLGASVRAGREFNPSDRPGGLPVAMVNQSFAEKFWPGMDPLGKRLRLFDRDRAGEWLTVVGVTSNIMQGDPTRQQFKPLVYVPFQQEPAGRAWVMVRTRVPPDRVAHAIQMEMRESDANVTVENFSTLQDTFGFRSDRMDLEHVEMGKNAALSPIFAAIASLLAVIGLYAVMAHAVNQRTREIGVRMAMGAAAEDIRRLVFRQGMTPVAAGLLLGLATSAGVNRVLQSQLVGVSPYDPFTMAAAPMVLIAVALLGCQIPARRAMRVDPAVALRQD